METKTFDAGLVFSGRASGTSVLGCEQPTAHTPAVNPSFQLCDWHTDVIAWACHMPDLPIYIYGPTGCGKSSILREIAARLNWPVYEITGHEALQSIDLMGHMALHGGDTAWVDGPLASAMRHGGLFLFNELDACMPGATIALNTVLDGASLCLPDNNSEVIPRHPMFRFAATGNTSGNGDETGGYAGTARQNIALLDRFFTCHAGYASEAVETQLLRKAAPTLPDTVIQYMRQVTALTRQPPADDPDAAILTAPVSTRTLALWARCAEMFSPLSRLPREVLRERLKDCGGTILGKALCHAIGDKRSEAERKALLEILQRITGEGD